MCAKHTIHCQVIHVAHVGMPQRSLLLGVEGSDGQNSYKRVISRQKAGNGVNKEVFSSAAAGDY